MMIDSSILKSEEKAALRLRALYRLYGYSCFKMRKFEAYDLYSQNKEFLVSDGVITFTDTNGKLMALKPDVTLSIVKNTVDVPQTVQRLYYNENVYRISDKTHQYKEIMQAGLECIGDLTAYNHGEVLRLAARSLQTISEESVLSVSHLGVISALMDLLPAEVDTAALLKCIREKNPHGLQEICDKCHLPAAQTALWVALTSAYGCPEEVIARLHAMIPAEDAVTAAALHAALDQLSQSLRLCGCVEGVRICVDFSLTGDMNYYNGLIFHGYVKGIPTGVLGGGQYDCLMEKMGKTSRAIGFAVYLDLLERLEKDNDFDVDVLLLCEKEAPAEAVAARVEALTAEGKRVTVQTAVPEKLRYRTLEKVMAEGENH